MLFTAYGVAGITGALAAGLIVDFTGTYFLAFTITGVLAIVAILFAILLYRIRRPSQK